VIFAGDGFVRRPRADTMVHCADVRSAHVHGMRHPTPLCRLMMSRSTP
jgi:hypothetical protein